MKASISGVSGRFSGGHRYYRVCLCVDDVPSSINPEDVAKMVVVHDDLLDALENMLALFDGQGDTRPYTWQERLPLILAARSVISKARGQQ